MEVFEEQERARELQVKNDELEKTVFALREDQAVPALQTMALFERVVAGVTHGINTPLGILISNLDIAARSLAKVQQEAKSLPGDSTNLESLLEPALSLVNANHEACNRISQLVSSLKCFVRLDQADFKEADINEGLKSTLALIQHEFEDRIKVESEFGDLPQIPCYPDRLNMVFMNLLLNSCQAIQGEGEIHIATTFEHNHVQVIVRDSGSEIQESVAAQTSDPLSSIGLDLSILTQIIKTQAGSLDFRCESGGGRTFTILLPAAATEAGRQF